MTRRSIFAKVAACFAPKIWVWKSRSLGPTTCTRQLDAINKVTFEYIDSIAPKVTRTMDYRSPFYQVVRAAEPIRAGDFVKWNNQERYTVNRCPPSEVDRICGLAMAPINSDQDGNILISGKAHV